MYLRRSLSLFRCFSTSSSTNAPVTVGIRREDPQRIWERRAPLTPSAVKDLVQHGVNVQFEHCDRRIFQDADYIKAGATLKPNLEDAHIIVGIKETPLHEVITTPITPPSNSHSTRPKSARTHLMFSHTAKGQPYNTPLLAKFVGDSSQDLLPNESMPRLIDYELLTNDSDGKRTTGFGWFAGVAGVLESLSSMAHSHLENGIASPFLHTPRPHTHPSIKSLREALRGISDRIIQGGTPPVLGPFVIGLTGNGKVSQGCLDILSELPIEKVKVKDLHSLVTNKDTSLHKIYLVHAKPQDYLVRSDGRPYDRADYYSQPHLYQSKFSETVAPYLTLFLNGIGWSSTFPRLMTNEQLVVALERACELGGARFTNIGDISCDIEGGLGFLTRATTLSSPFYKIMPYKSPSTFPFPSVQIMSVDILPASLPLDASRHFSECLSPYLESLIRSYQTGASDKYTEALNRATIAQNGVLLKKHEWLQGAVDKFYAAQPGKTAASEVKSQPEIQGEQAEVNGTELMDGSSRPTGRVLKKKNVLMLGSGMVAGPAVGEISKRTDIQLVVASNSIAELERLAQNYNNLQHRVLDISDEAMMSSLIAQSDVVISLLPAPFHPGVARLCVAHKKHLVTASYISQEMSGLHKSALNADVLLLNEIGLDPGIDHCSAIDLMSTLRSQKKEILSFTSFCGGLPAPDVEHTPLRYKFSWNPRGVLIAATNPAQFKLNNTVHKISDEDLLKRAFPQVPITPDFALEGIANRDSLVYGNQYGIESARTILRGTLRYPGFASLMQSFRNLGFLDTKHTINLSNWSSFATSCLSHTRSTNVKDKTLIDTIASIVPSEDFPALLEALSWFGLLPESRHHSSLPALPSKTMSALDTFAYLLAHKLAYKPHERDMVVLSHELVTQRPDGSEKEVHMSSLITYGTAKESAMARTVGIPVAIAALGVLDGRIAVRGVQGPTDASIYKPVLRGLEEVGLGMRETTHVVGNHKTLEEALMTGMAT